MPRSPEQFQPAGAQARTSRGLLAAVPGVIVLLLMGLPSVLAFERLGAIVSTALDGHIRARGFLLALVLSSIAHLCLRHRESYRFLSTLQHEVAHLLVGLAVLVAPQRLTSSHSGGELAYQVRGPFAASRALLLSTAPYWFSPLYLVLPMTLLLRAPESLIVATGTSMPLALGGVLIFAQYHRRQVDLIQYGFLRTAALAAWASTGVLLALAVAVWSWRLQAVAGLYRHSWRHLLVWWLA